MQHNPERRPICTSIFREILSNNLIEIDIKKSAQEVFENSFKTPRHRNIRSNYSEIFAPDDLFKILDDSYILNTRLDKNDVFDYIQKRFFDYDTIFKKEYQISTEDFTLIAITILDALAERAKKILFYPESYQFESKAEYGNLGFLKIPDKDYIYKWSRVMTFSKKDILDRLPKEKAINIDFFLDNYSFTQKQVQLNPELRFQEKPILKIDNTKFVLAFPFLLITCLPQKFEFLLQKIPKYSSDRGHTFEGMALDLFTTVICKNFRQNFVYSPSDGEIDGILEFEKNFWLIECKSRPVSVKSLQGDYRSIQTDVNKTIKKSEKQIGKALKNIEKLILNENVKKNPGEIIVLDGIYPPLNTTTIFCVASNKLKIPRLVINYFDLKDILNHPHSYLFEEFLIWRTQKDMPIMCNDELDYWIWFLKYWNDPQMEEAIKKAIQNHNTIIYRGW